MENSNGNLILNDIWAEKYRPKNLDDCILEQSLKNELGKLKKLNHFIFYGSYGVGKTSVAMILANKFSSPEDILIINAADENGIDTVRVKIKNHMSYQSVCSDYKVVILNEASFLSKSAQEALRSPLEEYSKTCRFIFTTNDLNAIDDAIKSRCPAFEFKSPEKKDFAKLIINIAEKEHIELQDDNRQGLRELVLAYYPDLRKTINEFEKCCFSGKFVWKKSETWMDELYNKITSGTSYLTIREWFIKNHYSKAINMSEVYRYLFKKCLDNSRAVELISYYMDKKTIDEEINFTAFLIELERILKNV